MQSSLVDKLRKVLALTSSPNENEAAAASAHLQRLLREHNLEMADLEQRGNKAPVIHEGGHDLGKAAFKWKLDLAETIADHYYCYGIVDRRAKTVQFVGRPDNVESLRMLYAWLIDQIKRISKEEREKHTATTGEHVDPLRWQVGFGEGAARRMGDRLADMKQAQSDNAGTALAVHHQAEISDYLEEKYGYRADGQKTEAQRKREIEYERRRAADEELERTDIEAFYAKYPWRRPETEEQKAEREKREAARQKKEARNARRRTDRTTWKFESEEDQRKSAQVRQARDAGYASADRVNLQPFIEGGANGDSKAKLR